MTPRRESMETQTMTAETIKTAETSRPTIQRGLVADLDAMAKAATLPECTSWVARDADGAIVGQAVVAIYRGIATLLQVTGTPGVQANLVAEIVDQTEFPLTAMLVPPSCSEWPLGRALESFRGIRLASADGQLGVHVLPIHSDEA